MPVTIADPWTSQKNRQTAYFEYVRDSGYKSQIGKSPYNVIQFSDDLEKGGGTIGFPLLNSLSGAGVSGSNTLQGNEEAVSKFNHKVEIEYHRHAIETDKKQQHLSDVQLYEKFSPLLKDWCTNLLRNSISDAMLMAAPTKTLHAPLVEKTATSGYNNEATAAEKNAWLTLNAERVRFGADAAKLVAGDFAASLANVTETDKLSWNELGIVKRKMKNANPRYKPIRVKGTGQEFFMVYVGSNAFEHLSNDPAMVAANREARPRDVKSNPLFQDGDLIAKGMIVREVPELPAFAGAGAGGIDVAPAIFCGAQAIAYAQGAMMRYTKNNNDDYGFKRSRGVEEFFGITKMQKDGVDHGTFTAFYSGAE